MCVECKSMIAARCGVLESDIGGSYYGGYTIDGMLWYEWYEAMNEEDAGLPECR